MKMTTLMNIRRAVQLLVLFSIVTFNSRCNGHPFGKCKGWGFELTIVHIGDIHARFDEVNRDGGTCQSDDLCIGGLARVLTASQKLLHGQSNTIFLNAGDNYQGTLWYNIHKWKPMVQILNMLPIDVMTIGNHEFDDGIDGLVPFLEGSKTPAVLCNVDTDSEPRMKNLIRKSHIHVTQSGEKIGVIGVIFKDVPETTYTERLRFTNEIESIDSEAAKLKKLRVNKIIVLSHCGIEIDRIIAAQCPDVDVIVGGHSHIFLYRGKVPRGYDEPVGEYPIVVKQPETKRTVLIVHASAFTKYLGHLKVYFDERGEVVTSSGNPIRLDGKQDSSMLRALEPFKIEVDKASRKVIGRTDNILLNDCRYGECNIGNVIADAMVASYIDRAEEKDWTYASIAINHAGAIKGSIKPGVITYGDIIRVHSYEDTWDVIELQGRHLYQILKESFSSEQSKGRLGYKSNLIWSGIHVVFTTAEQNPGIANVKVRCQNCEEPKYEYLRDSFWYRIIVPSFDLRDSSSILGKEHRTHEPGPRKDEKLVEFIQKMSPLRYNKEGRVHYCDRMQDKHCGNHRYAYDKLPNIFRDYVFRENYKHE